MARTVTDLALMLDAMAGFDPRDPLSRPPPRRAMREREALYQRVVQFFETYDLLLTPTVIVPPFDVDQRYVEQVEGHRFETYWEWLGLTYAVTLSGCPSLSLPCGFTQSGLPVGLQMVGRPYGDGELLGFAA